MMARTKLVVKVVERQEDHDKRDFDGIRTMEFFRVRCNPFPADHQKRTLFY